VIALPLLESRSWCRARAPATETPVLNTTAVATKYTQFARFIPASPQWTGVGTDGGYLEPTTDIGSIGEPT